MSILNLFGSKVSTPVAQATPERDDQSATIADLQEQVNSLLAMLAEQQKAAAPTPTPVLPVPVKTNGISLLASVQAPPVAPAPTDGMSAVEIELFTSAQKSLYSRSVDTDGMSPEQIVKTALNAGWPTKNAKLSSEARQALGVVSETKPVASKPKKSKGKATKPKSTYSLVNGLWVNDGIGAVELQKAIKDAQNGDYVSNALQHAITAHIASSLSSLLQGKTSDQRQIIVEQFTQENWGVERSKVTCGCLYGGKSGCRTHQNLALQQSGDTKHLLAWAKANNVPATWTNNKGKQVALRPATILKRARKAGYDQHVVYDHNNPYK